LAENTNYVWGRKIKHTEHCLFVLHDPSTRHDLGVWLRPHILTTQLHQTTQERLQGAISIQFMYVSILLHAMNIA